MPRLSLVVQVAEDANDLLPPDAPSIAQFRKWVKAALHMDAEIALRIVGEEEGRGLNRTYRQKDYATNVLTFPLTEEPWLMGDIVLCAPVVMREAKEQGKSLEAHFAHLTIHGVLHLQGHDHESEPQAEFMESIETDIMQRLGFADPYSS